MGMQRRWSLSYHSAEQTLAERLAGLELVGPAPAHSDARPDSVAGLRGLELANVTFGNY
jgi:hypothetical protein